METFVTISAISVITVNGLAAIVGGLLWWRVEPRAIAWTLIRAGQATAILLAIAAGAVYVSGQRPDTALFWVYTLVPVGVSFFAEQFRVLSAQTVLDARGLPDAQAVGRLPEREQHSIALQIARRELGIMAIAAAVIAFLALRAAGEAAGLS
jgi:hypothetical protein